jgi:hypothetical protein
LGSLYKREREGEGRGERAPTEEEGVERMGGRKGVEGDFRSDPSLKD